MTSLSDVHDDPMSDLPVLDSGALYTADMAFIDAPGSTADKVRAAVAGYLWAVENKRNTRIGVVYPSLNNYREAVASSKARASSKETP